MYVSAGRARSSACSVSCAMYCSSYLSTTTAETACQCTSCDSLPLPPTIAAVSTASVTCASYPAVSRCRFWSATTAPRAEEVAVRAPRSNLTPGACHCPCGPELSSAVMTVTRRPCAAGSDTITRASSSVLLLRSIHAVDTAMVEMWCLNASCATAVSFDGCCGYLQTHATLTTPSLHDGGCHIAESASCGHDNDSHKARFRYTHKHHYHR